MRPGAPTHTWRAAWLVLCCLGLTPVHVTLESPVRASSCAAYVAQGASMGGMSGERREHSLHLRLGTLRGACPRRNVSPGDIISGCGHRGRGAAALHIRALREGNAGGSSSDGSRGNRQEWNTDFDKRGSSAAARPLGGAPPRQFQDGRRSRAVTAHDYGSDLASSLREEAGGRRIRSMQQQRPGTGERGGRQGFLGTERVRNGSWALSTGSSVHDVKQRTKACGITHAKTGQAVEVMYDSDWRPAVVVGLTRYKEVVVQYVGGNEHCRETIDIRSDRMRPMNVRGSGTVLRTDGTENRTSNLKLQLGWCAEIAADAAERGRRTASVPLVASQSAIGWRRRREAENWFGSWTLPGREREQRGRGVSVAQLPRDLASFRSLFSLLDALEAAIAAAPGGFGAKQGVVAMNHIKRLSWQCQGDTTLKGRLTETMRHFALAAANGIDHLSSKDIALMLNAVTSVLDVKTDCPGVRTQKSEAQFLAPSYTSSGSAVQGAEHPGDACVFRGLFETASRRLLKLDTLYTAHAMAGVPDFDNPGKFTSQGVAMVANALGHAGIRDEALLAMISRVVCKQLNPEEYTAQSVSLIAAAFERLAYDDPGVFAQLADAAVAIPVRSFDGQALSSLLWSLSRRGQLSTNVRLLRKIRVILQEMPVRKWNVQHLCRALQAVSSAYVKMIPHNESASEDRLGARSNMSEGGSAQAAVQEALAGVALYLFEYTSKHVFKGDLPLEANVSPSSMGVLAAECVWACERGFLSQTQRDDVLYETSRAATSLAAMCVHAFSHRDVSVLLAAFSRARTWGRKPSSALTSSSDAALQVPGAFADGKGRSLAPGEKGTGEQDASVQSAYAAICRSMMDVLAALPVERANVGDLVTLMLSMARAIEARALQGMEREMMAMSAVLLRHVSSTGLESLSSKQLVDVVVSAARCGVRDVEAIRRLSAAAVQSLREESQSLGRASMQQEHISVDDIGALVRAVAYLNIVDRHLLSASARVLLKREERHQDWQWSDKTSSAKRRVTASAQAVANVAWAAAVMGDVDEDVHIWIGACLEDSDFLASLSPEQSVSLHQYIVEYDVAKTSTHDMIVSSSPARGAALLERCRGAMDVAVASGTARGGVSATQRQVLEELHNLHYAPREEFVDASTGYSIDAVVLIARDGVAAGHGDSEVQAKENIMVAIEVDGPSHFAHNFPNASDSSHESRWRDLEFPCGGTAMKRRHLSRCGYAVVPVPYWEWDSLNENDESEQREARQTYLRVKLRGALPTEEKM